MTNATCPTCGQPRELLRGRQKRQYLLREIEDLQRQILAIQQGSVMSTIQHQIPAASCTICRQAAPGKPGQPTPAAEMVRPLRRRLIELEVELAELNHCT